MLVNEIFKGITDDFLTIIYDFKDRDKNAKNLSDIVNEDSKLEDLTVLRHQSYLIEPKDMITLYKMGEKQRARNNENLNDYSVECTVIMHYIANSLKEKDYEKEAGILRDCISFLQNHYSAKYNETREKQFKYQLIEKFGAIAECSPAEYKKIRKVIKDSVAELRTVINSVGKKDNISGLTESLKQEINNCSCINVIKQIENSIPEKHYAKKYS